MKTVSVLGSTGSIGRSTLDVVRALRSQFRVVALAASGKWELLAQQAEEFQPERIALADASKLPLLKERLSHSSAEILGGEDAVVELAGGDGADVIVIGISGAAALRPTLRAVQTGKTVALANKESVVMAGDMLMRLAAEKHSFIIPVDSEHSGIFQLLRAGRREELRRVVLTASGGPFCRTSRDRLRNVKPEDALRHPNWSMGQKITIDSATMMNKGLEVIEARWLFDLDVSRIGVIIQPESIIHAMIEFLDGSVMAQMAPPDMCGPIQYALTYPDHVRGAMVPLDLTKLSQLTFMEPDTEKFPALLLGFRAAEEGGTMGCVLNAANETAVSRFLRREVRFTDISIITERVMDAHHNIARPGLEQILEADRWARLEAAECSIP